MSLKYVAGCVAACSTIALGQHQTEILVGHTSAGQIRVNIEGDVPAELNASVFPGFPGWAEAHPGFESLVIDDPQGDFYVLPETANIQFTFVSSDAEVRLWNINGSAPLTPGQTFLLGNPFFDIHPVWNIVNGRIGQTYTIRLSFQDLSGQFTPSDLVEVILMPADCYANCDASAATPVLTANDFQCYLNKFAAGDPYANCDGSTASPLLTANDFQCFLNAYASGCE